MVDLTKKNGFVVVAHRGASGYMPENTFASFDKAIELGADMFELDVHPTKDGTLVVMHDDTVDRTTDGHGRISSMTLEEIKGLNAAAKFPGSAREPVPTFSEVLQRYSDRIQMMVEVKHGSSVYPGVERRVIEELMRHHAAAKVELISFDFDCLRNLRRESAMVKTGFIFIGNMASSADMVGREVDALHGMWNFITKAQVDYARGLGYPTYLWTVNNQEDLAEAIALVPDGLVSNFPDKALDAVRRAGKSEARN